MASPQEERFSQLRWLHNAACVVVIVASMVALALGVIGNEPTGQWWMVLAGGLGLFLGVVMMTVMPLLVKMEATFARQLRELRDLKGSLDSQQSVLSAIAENTRISDAAKSLTHRQEEVDAIRDAIRDSIRARNWDVGLGLLDEMERRFGFRDEAEAMRGELDDARRRAIQSKLAEAATMIEQHFAVREWDRAQTEIERLRKALPDDAKVLALQDRMRQLREEHKEELRRSWDEAVRRSDTDHAIDILRELDQYLSASEARELQESARDVFKEKLLQLGVQFRFAITEKRWQDAIGIGLELVRDFPNARMANEVREVLDTLRERARDTSESTTH